MYANASQSQVPMSSWTPGQRGESTTTTTTTAGAADSKQASPGNDVLPSVSVPKAGGALRSMGESFSVDLLSGTGALTVPIRVSPGRSGFAPELSLTYSSSSSNGSFGMGWSLGLPTITRKTDKVVPQYLDGDESDTFILSGHDDLIQIVEHKAGRWGVKTPENRTTGCIQYEVKGYRPRTEGLFSRIEKWTAKASGETHWRTISKENMTMLFGRDSNSRIAEPGGGRRVFSWLLSASYDDKGNAAVYQYKEEDSVGINLAQANEYNRSNETRSAARHIKRIKYGNVTSRFVEPDLSKTAWLFEVVFDYGEHDAETPSSDEKAAAWLCRNDPFSTCKSGFEIRNYRFCQRILMFHHFPTEPDIGLDCLVASTDLAYLDDDKKGGKTASFLAHLTYRGYERRGSSYLPQSLPPLEFQYSPVTLHDQIQTIDLTSLENLPMGIDQSSYKFIDLDGEGIASILVPGPKAWYCKSNLGHAHFGPLKVISEKPASASDRFMDLNGDGQLALVQLDGPTPGFFERNLEQRWDSFSSFGALPNVDWDNPNLRLVDLTGDGRADILITEEDVHSWYPSNGRQGFGNNRRWLTPLDDELGPRLVFVNSQEEIHLADMSGDGLLDIVRVRNSGVIYWPNLGYGRFGSKVAMDQAPRLDASDCFDARKVRMADIDGSGTTDLLYLGPTGVQIYFNQAGNSFSEATILQSFPPTHSGTTTDLVDLFGNGTSCLVWSSPLPGSAGRQMQYIDLMGGQKPHLLTAHANNMGSETHLEYVSSTKFYLEDKAAGTPWITRLPFPMHLVGRVKTLDRVSHSVFTSQYRYRHGFFDSVEREFGGFGYVDQLDTETLSVLSAQSSTNLDVASYIPPILTKTWYHTGIYFRGDVVSRHFEAEYYREPTGLAKGVLSDDEMAAMLLDDTILPIAIRLPNGTDIEFDLLPTEAYGACRSLKGSILRQEVYAFDGSVAEKFPYSVSERNYTIMALQPEAGTKHAVFTSHQREALEFSYERNLNSLGEVQLPDPRVTHSATLDVDVFGNALQVASVAYGRRRQDQRKFLTNDEHTTQRKILATYSTSTYTNDVSTDDSYRARHLCESMTYELINCQPQQAIQGITNRFSFDELKSIIKRVSDGSHDVPFEDTEASTMHNSDPHRRLLKHSQSRFRADDLSTALPFKEIQALGLPYETYTKALTGGLAKQVYVDNGKLTNAELRTLLDEARYTHRNADDDWWLPSGKVYYSPDPWHTASDELTFAQRHFFHPHRYRNPYHSDGASTDKIVHYDKYCLLPIEVRDVLNNRITVGERGSDSNAPIEPGGNDYRVLKPVLVMDSNRNRTAVRYNALGLLAGAAVMGKPEEYVGDSMNTFDATLADETAAAFLSDPERLAPSVLGSATNRIVYDVFAYFRTRTSENPQPAVAVTLARQLHGTDGGTKPIQLSFSYSDGFGRNIQQKITAEPGPGPFRHPTTGEIVVHNRVPQTSSTPGDPRWIASGWTIYNNKGLPVKQYEPFFTDTAKFEFAVKAGVGAITFYDPLQREIGQINPDHTWTKTVFDAWSQELWDANDTAQIDPATDRHLGSFFRRLPTGEYMPTWAKQRDGGQIGPDEQSAALKCMVHRDTPTVTLFDSLARPFAVISHNKQQYSTPPASPAPLAEEFHVTRMKLDIESNHREVIDTKGRVVRRRDFTMMGKTVHDEVMDAGERWMLHDVSGNLCHSWDSRNHRFRTTYDQLRRPSLAYVSEGGRPEQLVGRTIYGEEVQEPEKSNARGMPSQVFDQAGIVTSVYDFKGNITRSNRQLAAEYKATIDWSSNVPLEAIPSFTTKTSYDAMNRTMTVSTPDGSVMTQSYNRTGLLKTARAQVRGDASRIASVENIEYDAKGQRTRVAYGNGTETTFEFDPMTFRLRRMRTVRNKSAFPDDWLNPNNAAWPGCQLQDLTYTYDPVGNVTHIKDSAQQRIFFRNQRVEPSNDYTYSADYRLIEAVGREQLGQAGNPIVPSSSQVRSDHPNQDNAMGTYLEQYVWDSAGNIMSIRHERSDAASQGWTRRYSYREPSALAPPQIGNRMSTTQVSDAPQRYTYDEHGNMTSMPGLPVMRWDYRDQLRATARQVVRNGGSPETTWYTYDSSGIRVRKVTEREVTDNNPTPRVLKERIYLDGCEIYRTYGGDGQTKTLERQTLYLSVGSEGFARVETRIAGDEDGNPGQLTRYQLLNHLDSVQVELDDQSRIISYEEYSPFGTSTYRATRSRTETPKRYGFTDRERDEESGLSYHGARYYISWLARWASCDPVQDNAPRSLYAYGRGNPIIYSDPSGTEDSTSKQNRKKQSPKHAPKSSPKAPSRASSAPPSSASAAAPSSAAPAPATITTGPLKLPSTKAEGAAFVANVKARLKPSTAVEFDDRGVHVVVMPLPTPSIVHGGSTFTGAATAGDAPDKADFVINGLLYKWGPFTETMGEGQVIEGGRVTHGASSVDTFYFAWDRYKRPDPTNSAGPPLPRETAERTQWKFGKGNPPAGSDVAMGGGKPLIIGGLPYGDDNQYKSGTPAGLPLTGDPGAGNEQYLTQRSNRGYTALNREGALIGNTVMAVSSQDNLLVLLVHEHGRAPGITLQGMRDSLVAMGASDALAYDGSDSATLVRDKTVVVTPGMGKNRTIPAGIRFRF